MTSIAEIASAIRRHRRVFAALGATMVIAIAVLNAHAALPEHHHHHVVCSGCGAVAHVHDEAIAAAVACVQAASGYRLERQELTFAGLCPGCARPFCCVSG